MLFPKKKKTERKRNLTKEVIGMMKKESTTIMTKITQEAEI